MKLIKNILILIILLLVIYAILNYYKILRLQKIQEGFTSEVWSGVNKFFGNCIYNNNNPKNTIAKLKINNTDSNIEIKLPSDSKITGFRVDLIYKNKSIEPGNIEERLKYSLSIGNDISNMVDIINKYGFNKFNFNTDIKDIDLFENDDGTHKYNGKNIIIKLQNIKDDNGKLNINNNLNDYEFMVKIYGLDVYGLNSKTYGNYIGMTKELKNNEIDLTSNKKIVSIDMGSKNITNDIIQIIYDNTFDNNKRKYIAVGPIMQGFDISKVDSNIIYFNKPIIASKLYFKNLKEPNTPLTLSNNIVIYSLDINKRDEINFKFDKQLETNNKLGLSIQGEKCPGINQLMRRQMQAQQICEALEYKDRIRNSKVVYEKEKTYLKKLAEQEKELQELEKLINSIISRKNDRIKNNKYHSVEALDKELRKIEEIRKQAELELLEQKEAHDLKVELNLEPKFNDILAKYNLK